MTSSKETQDQAQSLFEAALGHHRAGRIPFALEGYRAVLQLDSDHAQAWNNLAVALRRLEKFEAAVGCYKRALSIRPDDPGFIGNLGNVLKDLDRMEESLQAHAVAAALRPDDGLIRQNYGIALREAGRFEEALAEFDAACAIDASKVQAKWDRAITYLHLGRFDPGWQAFESRWETGDLPRRDFSVPRWRGEDFAGKTLLVHAEQGFGDTILAARFLPMVKARGGQVILECKESLHRLFQGLDGVDRLVLPDQIAESFDLHMPLMSLPGVFDTRLDSIPPPATLNVAAELAPEVKALLDAGGDRLKVGVVWSGSITFKGNRKRSVPASQFLPLAEIEGLQLYSLQKGPREKDLADCGGQATIWELGPHLHDFADTAAAVQALDLVVMTDSSVAHLGGSLGRPVWNLLCFVPYWLYLWGRDDTPWYPSMRLFRQEAPGDWDGLFDRLTAELGQAARLHRQTRAAVAASRPAMADEGRPES